MSKKTYYIILIYIYFNREHLLLQNEEMQHKCKELEEKNMKLHTDIEIGNMQLAKLKNALQEQIEQTRETLTNYSTSI